MEEAEKFEGNDGRQQERERQADQKAAGRHETAQRRKCNVGFHEKI